MREIISGRILAIDEEERLVLMKVKNRIRQFYFQRSMINRIGKYLQVYRFVQFAINQDERIYRGNKVSDVDYVVKIMEIRHRKNIVYYDIIYSSTV